MTEDTNVRRVEIRGVEYKIVLGLEAYGQVQEAKTRGFDLEKLKELPPEEMREALDFLQKGEGPILLEIPKSTPKAKKAAMEEENEKIKKKHQDKRIDTMLSKFPKLLNFKKIFTADAVMKAGVIAVSVEDPVITINEAKKMHPVVANRLYDDILDLWNELSEEADEVPNS